MNQGQEIMLINSNVIRTIIDRGFTGRVVMSCACAEVGKQSGPQALSALLDVPR